MSGARKKRAARVGLKSAKPEGFRVFSFGVITYYEAEGVRVERIPFRSRWVPYKEAK